MNERRFRIPAEQSVLPFEDNRSPIQIQRYVFETMHRLKDEHPHWMQYMYNTAQNEFGTNNWMEYGYGAALTADISSAEMQRQNIKLFLTDEDLKIHERTIPLVFGDTRLWDPLWLRNLIMNPEVSPAIPDSNLSSFLNLVDSHAAGFIDKFGSYVNQLPVQSSRIAALRGSYDGFMPLFRQYTYLYEMTE